MPDFSDYSGRIRHLVQASVAYETRRAYTSRLKRFVKWCIDKGLSSSYPITPEILAMYITDMAADGLSNATITQTMATISTTHKVQGLISLTESLLVKKVLRGFRREYGTAHKKHDAATVEIVRYLLNSIRDDNSPKNVLGKAIFPSKDKLVSPIDLLKRWLHVRGSYGALFQGKTKRSMNESDRPQVNTSVAGVLPARGCNRG